MKKVLLQIDTCLNMLSTGRITESIAQKAQERGWDTFIVHGARYVRPGSCMQAIQSTGKCGEYEHFFEGLLFDNHGLASRFSTRKVIEKIRSINPDIIQLHCIHGYYMNYRLLFEFLNASHIPVVWTFHDCWAFTGHCSHFATISCEKWKEKEGGCHDCPLIHSYPKSFVDNSRRNYELKKRIFTSNKNLHIVAVSNWLSNYIKESFFKNNDIRIINNGVDIHKFKSFASKSNNCFKIIGVASSWDDNKGLRDFCILRELLPLKEYDITLVGLSHKQIGKLPYGIMGINRTDSVDELAHLYSDANVFVNPTYADSFPSVNMEALACGTPVITYNTGGSPEIIDRITGVVIEQGDINGLAAAIKQMKDQPLSLEACRKRAVDYFDKEKRFTDYVNLYESLI